MKTFSGLFISVVYSVVCFYFQSTHCTLNHYYIIFIAVKFELKCNIMYIMAHCALSKLFILQMEKVGNTNNVSTANKYFRGHP